MDLLNQSKIDRLAGEIGEENVPLLLDIFLGELAQYIEKLSDEELPNMNSYLAEICHALKSSAASFGAEALCAFAIEVDAIAKVGDITDLESTRQKMIALLKETQQRYQKLIL